MSEINPIVLESVQNDVALIGQDLKGIATRVIEEGISEYPVFIVSHEYVPIGKPVFDRESVQLNWFFFASILEDFVKKDIVSGDKIKQFQNTFGDPLERACIFVLTPEISQFVFVPYDIDAIDKAQDQPS